MKRSLDGETFCFIIDYQAKFAQSNRPFKDFSEKFVKKEGGTVTAEKAIVVQSLSKFYDGKPGVVDISFSVGKGDVVGFLGPNGAGKTTTLNCITGVLTPDSGVIQVDGHDTVESPMEVRKRIGYLPEIAPLYPDMTVEEYLTYAAQLRDVPKNRIRESVERAMEACGITDVRKRLIRNLSKGYGQRVGIAQAIVHDPPILILDEPTIGLDPIQIQEIRNLIRELSGSHTIFLSTHILPEVTMICNRVIIINDGKIAAEDTLEGLTRRVKRKPDYFVRFSPGEEAEAEKFLSSLSAVEDCRRDGSGFVVTMKNDESEVDEIVRGAVERNLHVRELSRQTASLEDIFVRLTTEETAGGEEE
ncbi:MAG: ABC transporter ATP-binding protein [Deltaproteobacteria bacterium]|nr:MAG: ABC transporter ATP-binding protein [Deltaproteobacteria bacterium]